ncbi:MAG: type VI secretion protein [Flavobacterium sp.]|nr:type VI secretion protein [Flavobacterium sp.]
MAAAARITDMHTCPLVNGTVPHVGGPLLPGSNSTVLIGGLPASIVGDSCVCTGPTDSLSVGSSTVSIAGSPAVRMGDATAHGGVVVAGCPTVIIGG